MVTLLATELSNLEGLCVYERERGREDKREREKERDGMHWGKPQESNPLTVSPAFEVEYLSALVKHQQWATDHWLL